MNAFLIFGLCFQISVNDMPFAILQVSWEYNSVRISAADLGLPPPSDPLDRPIENPSRSSERYELCLSTDTLWFAVGQVVWSQRIVQVE